MDNVSSAKWIAKASPVNIGKNDVLKWLLLFMCTIILLYCNISASLYVNIPYQSWYHTDITQQPNARMDGYKGSLLRQLYNFFHKRVFQSEHLNTLATHTNLTWTQMSFETLDRGLRKENMIYISRAFYEKRSKIAKVRLFTMDTVRERNGTFFCLIWTEQQHNKPHVVPASVKFMYEGHVNNTINGRKYMPVNYDCPINFDTKQRIAYVTLLPIDYKMELNFKLEMKRFQKEYAKQAQDRKQAGKKNKKGEVKEKARRTARQKSRAVREFQLKLIEKELANLDIPADRKTPVTYPVESDRFEHEFGLCVCILHGTITDDYRTLLIEWFEFHRLLGVTEFNIYNGTLRLEPQIHRIFEYYINTGVLRFHKQQPPITVGESSRRDAALLTRMNTFQECINSNMNRYRFLVVVDNDEVIVPHQHDTYREMMQELHRQNGLQYGKDQEKSFIFESMDFYGEFEQMTNESELSIALRYQSYVAMNVRPKSIHNPRLCMRLNPHTCRERRVTGASIINVNMTFAAVHHYRRTCVSSNNPVMFSKQACEQLKLQQQHDSTVLRFKDKLLSRLSKVHRLLGFI